MSKPLIILGKTILCIVGIALVLGGIIYGIASVPNCGPELSGAEYRECHASGGFGGLIALLGIFGGIGCWIPLMISKRIGHQPK